ncbi:MAG: hypothetical protein ACR2GK_07400 [Gemmatimonadaceae bacterium]
MQLNDADKEKVLQWVQEKCGAMRCICCGTGNWELVQNGAIILGFDVRTTRFHYHEGIPIISIVCTNCGHVVSFAAGVMGFKPEPPPSPPSGGA